MSDNREKAMESESSVVVVVVVLVLKKLDRWSPGGGYSLQWAIRGGSARNSKGCLL